MAKKLHTFNVGAFVKVWTELEIPATSLADALEKSKTMTLDDFVTVNGLHNDSSFKIIQVFDSGFDIQQS
jgi:hypothetical protein